MTKDSLLNRLRHWLKSESYVDRDGNISPSKTAIDVTHFYFVQKSEYTSRIEDVRIDQNGGILVFIAAINNKSKFTVHVRFNGFIDYYHIEGSNVDKTKMPLTNNEYGFGTDKYKF